MRAKRVVGVKVRVAYLFELHLYVVEIGLG
jgi:hypothetical protein